MGPKAILAVVALVHIGFGLWGMSAPDRVAAMFELQPLTSGALGEIRAVYGGLVVALGVAIGRGAFGGTGARPWLMVAALAYAGLVAGRIVSLALDGASAYTVLALGVEALMAAFLSWASTQGGPPSTDAAASPGEPIS